MEGDSTGLDLALLDIDLVTAEDDRNVLTDSLQVSVPVWNVLVGNSRGNIEHDDTALALDVIAITQSTKLLLTGRIPDVEANSTKVCIEGEWVYLYTKRGNVLLLEFYDALFKRGFTAITISNSPPVM